MRIPVAKEGGIFLVASVLLAAVSFFFAWHVVGVLLLMLFVFFVFFFRIPERTIINDKDLVFSAADGKIVQIKRVEENEFLKTPATRISVFMSVFNVHVNLAPVSSAFFMASAASVLAPRAASSACWAAFRDV